MFKEVIGVESTRQETVKPDQLDMETKANRNYRKWNKFLLDFMDLLNKQFCLFIFREGEGRETSVCICFSHAPRWGPGPQPRLVPWLGIELQCFGLQARTQSTEPHQPGLKNVFEKFGLTSTEITKEKINELDARSGEIGHSADWRRRRDGDVKRKLGDRRREWEATA